MRVTNINSFLEKSTLIHGNNYDYSLVIYTKTKNDIEIICRKHDLQFTQSMVKHLNGQGCKLCGIEKRSIGRRNTTIDVLNKFKIIHNNKYKYEYDLSDYEKAHSIIKIKCTQHGWFSQPVYTHMAGHGCKECANILSSFNQMKSQEEAINSFLLKWGDQNDYTDTIYNGSRNIIEVKCNIHNVYFIQNANEHLNGHNGCNQCQNNSEGEFRVGKYLKENNIEYRTGETFIDCNINMYCPSIFIYPNIIYV